jgi:hypothetical protein
VTSRLCGSSAKQRTPEQRDREFAIRKRNGSEDRAPIVIFKNWQPPH